MQCEVCVHYNKKDCQCRKNPPTANAYGFAVWPRVKEWDWCSCFEEPKVPLPPKEVVRLFSERAKEIPGSQDLVVGADTSFVEGVYSWFRRL